MRLVFINNAHPHAPHVSGMRLSYFAQAMAQRGHQVVLLTGVPPGGRRANGDAAGLPDRLTRHDWSEPMIVEVAPKHMHTLEAMRHARVPMLLRRALTAWSFLAHGGVFADWTRAAKTVTDRLAFEFKPDLVWATFGNTSNLILAQRLARRAECPWVMDVKDNWESYVPAGLRMIMARRYSNVAGVTANAELQLEVANRWLSETHNTVIYSGVSDEFYGPVRAPVSDSTTKDILFTGSVRSYESMRSFLSAIRDWLESLPLQDRNMVRFCYAGTDAELVEKSLAFIALPCHVSISRQLPLNELSDRVKASWVNCYITASYGFHHKLLELLSVGKPVICFPAERAESLVLASKSKVPFYSCDSTKTIRAALGDAWLRNANMETGKAGDVLRWKWSTFAEELDSFFQEVATRELSAPNKRKAGSYL